MKKILGVATLLAFVGMSGMAHAAISNSLKSAIRAQVRQSAKAEMIKFQTEDGKLVKPSIRTTITEDKSGKITVSAGIYGLSTFNGTPKPLAKAERMRELTNTFTVEKLAGDKGVKLKSVNGDWGLVDR